MKNQIDSKKGYEVINDYVDGLKKEELVPFLKTILKEDESKSTLITNLVNSFIKFNNDDQIIEENWNWFYNTLEQIKEEKEFIAFCRAINTKLYVFKHFTKIKFGEVEHIANELKFQLKKHFNLLRTTTKTKFVSNLYLLPFEFSCLLVRFFMFKILESDDERQKFKASKALAEYYLKDVFVRKNKFIKQINDISLGLHSNISFAEIKELLELRVFYNYNVLNAGALEFILRFINKEEESIKKKYGEHTPLILREFIFTLPAYVFHIKKIKEGQDIPFFSDEGTQNEKKRKTFDDYVKQVLDKENYIPIEREVEEGENEEDAEENSTDVDNEDWSLESGNSKENEEEISIEEPSSEELL
jgi:hypothetical protein